MNNVGCIRQRPASHKRGAALCTNMKAGCEQRLKIRHKDAVLWAYQTGVVVGTSATTFEPDRPVTREQIAVILMEYMTRVLKLERTWTPADLSTFPDAGSVSGWAKDALADAVALGLISGASNGGQTYLEPQGSATREQVATILMEFCKNVKK